MYLICRYSPVWWHLVGWVQSRSQRSICQLTPCTHWRDMVLWRLGTPCLEKNNYTFYFATYDCKQHHAQNKDKQELYRPETCYYTSITNCSVQETNCTIHKMKRTIHKSNRTFHKTICTVHKTICTIHKTNCTVHKTNCTIHKAKRTPQKEQNRATGVLARFRVCTTELRRPISMVYIAPNYYISVVSGLCSLRSKSLIKKAT